MATADLQTYIEDRLLAAFPTVDLSPGSPAQVSFVQPLLSRLGTDPFGTDVDSFITDRFRQEFPDLYAGDPSAIRDIFIKPLILILEPLKREIQVIKKNQSLADPALLADEEADALVANVFDYRSTGKRAVGSVRVFFANPSNQKAEISDVAYTADGLNFSPIGPISITAEEMVFNREGSLFYFDIPCRAEKEGVEYNIETGSLVGYRGLSGYTKVSNPRRFTDGSQRIDTPAFVAQARESLNERSLLSRRGASARIRQKFQGDVRAVQVIGAGDKEMQRDILVAEGSGHTWLTGKVTLYKNIAYVQCLTVDGAAHPAVGDTLYFYADGATQRVTVADLIGSDFGPAAGGILSTFLVRWSGDFTAPESATVLWGGFTRKGAVRITSLPTVGEVNLEVASGEVHVYGHSDIYVRPVLQGESKAILASLSDLSPVVARTTLQTFGAASSEVITGPTTVTVKNKVTDTGFSFQTAGVVAGDLLTIEDGFDAGTYIIGKVDADTLFLSANLTQSMTNLRYRITRSITLNPFDPKILKLPFGTVLADDLQTVIASNVLRFGTDLLTHGAKVGDTIRIKDGLDQGDFTITGFQSGLAVLVDRPAKSSSAGIHYELFTPLDKVERPLVRLKDISLLDSSRKSTGIAVPVARPVAVVPQSDFTTARVRGQSQLASGFVLPAMNNAVVDYVTGTNTAAASVAGNDRRYSLGFDPVDGGIYKAVTFDDGVQSELLFPQDANSCSYFMLTVEDTSKAENVPPVEPKPNDALTVKNGPNAGSYLVKNVRKFKYRDGGKVFWLYFVQIHGTFPVDVFRQLIMFLEGNGQAITKITNGAITFPDFFTTNFYNALGTKLDAALTGLGLDSPGAVALQESVDSLLKCEYEWGDPARGVLRTYMLQPTVFEQGTAESPTPTLFDFVAPTGETVAFRPDPDRYTTHEVIPPRVNGDAAAQDYPRDLLTPAGNVASFDGATTVFNKAVKVGDVMEVFEEVFFHGASKDRETAVRTTAGSTRVISPTGVFASPEIAGNLLSIEEGADKGVYRVVKWVDAQQVILDRPLKSTTTPVIASGTGTYQHSGSDDVVVDTNGGFVCPSAWAGKYVTIYAAKGDRAGVESDAAGSYYCGSYRINSVIGNQMKVEREVDFPAGADTCIYLISEGQTAKPYGDGTELVAARPVRVYSDVTSKFTVTEVLTSPGTSMLGLSGAPRAGYRQPYRIYRQNIRRITSTEMDSKRDGFLCYFDTDVLSVTPSQLANIEKNSYLSVREGTYQSVGYRHHVADNTLSYSMKEEGTVELPAAILPVNSPDSPDNFITLVGTPVQVTYERADAVEQLQEFLESPEDRVTAANMLARHFLPAYVSYDAQYTGGSSPSVIAKDITDYINNLSVTAPVDVSVLQDLIGERGGNPKTPTKASITIHDWDRRAWVEFSEDEVGGATTRVPYNGTPRVTYGIPGTDASGTEVVGERIKLENS